MKFLKGVDLETRKNVFIRMSKIAGFLARGENGPTRILFDAGGSIDVCGAAELWELNFRIAPTNEEDAA
jgi:hypothetical protein